MKIFDCFMYFDEDVVLEARLNILDKWIDKFIIIESAYTHSGRKKNLLFKLENFKKFENKIHYTVCNQLPKNLENLVNNKDLNDQIKTRNAVRIENFQRNFIMNSLKECTPDQNDLVLISDIDEIPNLEPLNLENINNNLIFFMQRFFYYKFNLENINMHWSGTRMCKFKNLKSPQWLRNIKSKKYPFWRLDTFFDQKRYSNIVFVKNGGWHFTYIKDIKGIRRKLENYLHHVEFDLNPMTDNQIKNLVENHKILYDHSLDKTVINKFETGKKLVTVDLSSLPEYFTINKEKISKWLEVN